MAGEGAPAVYANALLTLAVEKGQDNIVFEAAIALGELIETNPELGRVLKSPIISIAKKQEIMTKLGIGSDIPLFVDFIALVCNRNRVGILPAILEQVALQFLTNNGMVKGAVLSATALDEAEKNLISQLAEKALGKKAILEYKTDASLIGGFIIKVGDRQIDQSVSSQLASLRAQFSN